MFGRDPFMHMFGEMHRSMREMDQMMNQMMDPFGMIAAPRAPATSFPFMASAALEGHPAGRPHNALAQHHAMMRDPFGFAGFSDIFSQMNGMAAAAMNDPNGTVFSSSTMISMDGSGRAPRIVESTTRRTGDVKETRRRVQNGEEEEMVIGHSIGDREHVLEKKRDKDGNVRRQQSFRNIDESEAEAFDREFQTRAEHNLRGTGFRGLNRAAIDGSRSGGARARGEIPSVSLRDNNGAIITLPEDDDETPRRPRRPLNGSSRPLTGPIIREISDEEAEQSVPKRRRDMHGGHRFGNQ